MTRMQPTQYADLGVKGPALVGVFAVVMFAVFVYIAPLTYGTPGYVHSSVFFVLCLLIDIGSLDGENVNSKRLLSSWTLHFAAKATGDAI